VLFAGLMRILSKRSDIRTILLPRNARQAAVIKSQHPEWFGSGKIIIPEKAVDGMNLIWHSDLVVSGGGTMNREAAALNVPVYSIFRGPRGAVDRNLSEQGRLTIIESQESLEKKIQFRKRERDVVCPMRSGNALECIVNYIEEIYAYYENRGRR
jgi:predicted glycosyltransferase